jgi:glyoxylase-like metal-dependent hydrolase (beta-lactamase superfamily II)
MLFQLAPFGTFDRFCSITFDDKEVVVPTQGHTPRHVSVIAVDGDVSYFLAGDATYTEQALLVQKVDGINPDQAAALRTLAKILAFARNRPTVYLPSHDPESMPRLKSSEVVPLGHVKMDQSQCAWEGGFVQDYTSVKTSRGHRLCHAGH